MTVQTLRHFKYLNSTPASVGELFIALWDHARRWDPATTHKTRTAYQRLTPGCMSLLQEHSSSAVLDALMRMLPPDGAEQAESGRIDIYSILSAIDNAFQAEHPRTILVSSTVPGRQAKPKWLAQLGARRLLKKNGGAYATLGGYRLVPRGPLLHAPREELESFGESLSDLFKYLSVVPTSLELNERPVHVAMSMVGSSLISGIATGSPPGKERVHIAPLAELGAEVDLIANNSPERTYIGYVPKASGKDSTVEKFRRAIAAVPDSDILMAPEFLLCEKDADNVSEFLHTQSAIAKKPFGRLIIAGSGLTTEHCQNVGMPWNECRVLNGSGAEIIRQRKLWPASMKGKDATSYGANVPEGTANVLEGTASGSTLHVVDIENFGRCVVLICQDFEGQPLLVDLLKKFQPDWVFVPIMDKGVTEGRWCHQQSYASSGASHARFIVASSTSLADKASLANVPCALAVSPRDFEIGIKRGVLEVQASNVYDARLASFQWDTAPWRQTRLGALNPAGKT